MKAKNIIPIFEEYRARLGEQSYRYLAQILEEAKTIHQQDLLEEAKISGKAPKDFEQSWKGVKGKALEELIRHILKEEIEQMGLAIASGTSQNTLKGQKQVVQTLYESLLIDYGELGKHLPDLDLVVYHPQSLKVIAILSVKSSLRERIAQAAYWSLKLSADEDKQAIRYFFLTIDSDADFVRAKIGKSRAIAERDTHGVYLLIEQEIVESEKVKHFDKLIPDLAQILQELE